MSNVDTTRSTFYHNVSLLHAGQRSLVKGYTFSNHAFGAILTKIFTAKWKRISRPVFVLNGSFFSSLISQLLLHLLETSSSGSSDGNPGLLNEGGSTSQVPQASVELADYGSVVWPDSLSEWLVDGTGLQRICCLTASTARALLCIANAEFGIQVIVEAFLACHLFQSG